MLASEYISKWMNIHILHSNDCEARGGFDFAPCTCSHDDLLNKRNADITSLSKEEHDKVISYVKEKIKNSKETTVCSNNDIESIKMKTVDKYTRPSLDLYFLQIANLVGTRGTCDRGRLGVVIVKDKRILTTGYVGSPAGTAHCDDIDHEMHTTIHEDGSKTRHCVRTAHAEINAICNAARHGVAIEGATLYGRFEPCYTCAKAIINAGIKRVVCEKAYHAAQESRQILKEANVELVVLNPSETEQYPDQKSITMIECTKEKLILIVEEKYKEFIDVMDLLSKKYPPEDGCLYGINGVGKVAQFLIQKYDASEIE